MVRLIVTLELWQLLKTVLSSATYELKTEILGKPDTGMTGAKWRILVLSCLIGEQHHLYIWRGFFSVPCKYKFQFHS